MKKYSAHFCVALLAGVYRAFVLMNLWNWFVIPVFHVSNISFLQVLGLSLVIQLFLGHEGNPAEEFRWKILYTVLDYCVPEGSKEQVKTELKRLEEEIWLDLALSILAQLTGTTVVLAIGFVIHLFS